MPLDKDLNDQGYDIVVGIPSYNEADSIAHVVRMVDLGLKTYFPDKKSIIVNVDNHSPDGTRAAFLGVETEAEKKYITTGDGVLGKGNNFLNLFEFTRSVHGINVIVVDADLKSITKEWIERLGRPLFEGYDYVTPAYSRHQFDATITNHICYPLLFGAVSADIRQPIGGDFAFSSRLMNHWLGQEWTESIRNYGIDIFMTLNAVFGGFRLCQATLGEKAHKPSAPKVGEMFSQVVETLLTILLRERSKWLHNGADHIIAPETFGSEKLPEPEEAALDIQALKEVCKGEYRKYYEDISALLEPYAFSRVSEMFEMDLYDMDILLWTQIFYTLLYRYDRAESAGEKRKVINTLKPLYFARSLSFNYNTWKYNVKYAELEIRKQALGFASQKYYLQGLYSASA